MAIIFGILCFTLAALVLLTISPMVFAIALVIGLCYVGYWCFTKYKGYSSRAINARISEQRRAYGYD